MKALKKPLIVHIISGDKFASGYVNFMKMKMTEWEHSFFVRDIGFELKFINREQIIFYRKDKELCSHDNQALLNKCDKIIISGAFYLFDFMKNASDAIIKKTYIQFWGGDFYCFRHAWKFDARKKKKILGGFVKKCAGTVSLIQGDIEQLQRIFPSENEHYVAQMPSDPMEEFKEFSQLDFNPPSPPYRILLGNSSTKENQHIPALQLISRFKNENIRIICPLSYGDMNYKKKVIEFGKQEFGDKFQPVENYMSKDEYIALLNHADMAVFNNNRQQALGNIWIMLRLGKKVFIRDDTAMWEHFRNLGVTVHSVGEWKEQSLQQLVSARQEEISGNHERAVEYDSGVIAMKQWKIIFDSKII